MGIRLLIRCRDLVVHFSEAVYYIHGKYILSIRFVRCRKLFSSRRAQIVKLV